MKNWAAFGNDELKSKPSVKEGDQIACPICANLHALECGTNETGEKDSLIMFYKCGKDAYLGAVAGKMVVK